MPASPDLPGRRVELRAVNFDLGTSIMPSVAEAEPPFRIAIDARPMCGSPCGYSIHLASIVALLRKANFDITLLAGQPLTLEYEELAGLKTAIFGSHSTLPWEHRDLPRFLQANDFDLYLSDANRGIPIRKNHGTRYILGLHDIIPYLYAWEYFGKNLPHRIKYPRVNAEAVSQLISVFRADAILTVSEQSAKDIATVFRRRNVTARLTRLKDVDLSANHTLKDQFVYVGGADPRKKVDVLIRAFALFAADHPNFQLYLIGSNLYYHQYVPLIAELGLTGRVVLTGFVSHEEKFRIIGQSVAMVYPSLYEGYGLALAEAMQAGIAVVAGRGGSQAEVGGDAVRYVDPTSAQEIACAMGEMLDPAVREAWVARGREQLKVLTDPVIEARLVDYFVEQGRVARGRRAKLKVHA